MTATTATNQRLNEASTPGFGATLASEWTKLRSVRSTWIIIGLALVLSIGFSALMAFTSGLTYDEWGEADQALFDPLTYSTAGVLFGLILLVVLGVTAVTSEYSSSMIRTTFIATPQRIKVLAAKALLIAVIGIILSTIMALGMFLVSQAIFGAYDLPTTALGNADVDRLMIVYSVAGGLIYTLIPLSIAYLLRGTASAITASIGLFFLPFMLGALLPAWFQENVIRYAPDLAMDSLAGVTASDSSVYLSQEVAIVTIAAWLVAGVVLSAIVLKRRDA